MKAKLKVWVVFDEGVKLGQGRAAFLRLIDKLGSIKQAVEEFEMSYRNAWGYLRELERAAGFRLLERKPGGSRAAGTQLTPEGREFLEKYERFERGMETYAAQCFARMFPPRQRSRNDPPRVRARLGGEERRSRGPSLRRS